MSSLEIAAADFIAHYEGFRTHAYWDVNHFRIGFGSDTMGATMIPVKKGSTESKADAIENLKMRIPRFIGVITTQIGKLSWMKLSQNEQVALIDVAYNYGHLPHSIVWACSHGDRAAISHAIISHEHDNRSINEARRRAEAALITETA